MAHSTSSERFLTIATDAVEDGFEVFPLIPRGKIPYAGSHGHLDATAQVSRWRSVESNANLGLRMPEGFVCLDEDKRGALRAVGLPLPPTREVRSRRGRHLYYRLPPLSELGDRRLRGKVDGHSEIDVKSRSGFTVGPGSVHASGYVYRLVRGVPLGEVPTLPAEWLPRITRSATQEELSGERTQVGQKATRHHPRRLGQLMRTKSEGTRRDFLRWAACEVHRNYSGDDLRVALAELEAGAIAAGLDQPDIAGLLTWATGQFSIEGTK
ncbi:MAG: bifunctional DNA primase/polymerase [Gordonia sp. (in: high G+C Gram-positive bacteria)]|uniref:bifunctional DNA primase/polymerase n=1 Tax=Gordonia sp. (in: high G+C Gram-positive bacteria) TaxID=84139 RepID=UPI003C739BCA